MHKTEFGKRYKRNLNNFVPEPYDIVKDELLVYHREMRI